MVASLFFIAERYVWLGGELFSPRQPAVEPRSFSLLLFGLSLKPLTLEFQNARIFRQRRTS